MRAKNHRASCGKTVAVEDNASQMNPVGPDAADEATAIKELQMHASHDARPANLPWLSWFFLASLLAVSVLIRTGNPLKSTSATGSANAAAAKR